MDGKRIEIVRFDGDELQVAGASRDDGWLVLRSGCEALGLDLSAQWRRLQRSPWARVAMMATPDARGHAQELFCLHIDSVPMWLATIQASRVRPEVRTKLERYQREAARVLAEHFLGTQPAVSVADIIDPKTEAVICQVANRIVTPILARFDRVESDVTAVKTDVAEVKTKVSTLERVIEETQAYRRKRIPESIKRRHEEFARAVMPKCLPCGAALFDGSGRFIGEHHHIEKASNATLEATMPVCPNCNKAFNLKPMPRHFAETYHERMRVWSGPLFAMVGKA